MIQPPSANGDNGRDERGRFTNGNGGGPGNPHARQVAKLRAAMIAAVSEQDIEAIVGTLIEQAKGGDVRAAQVVLDRCLGKPEAADILERIEQLEAAL